MDERLNAEPMPNIDFSAIETENWDTGRIFIFTSGFF